MRNTSAFLLVLVATLVAPLVIATSWLDARVVDREGYVETVAPLADDPAVRRQLGDAAASAAIAALEQYSPIGLPGQAEEWVRTAANEVVDSPGFPEFWREANADVHRDVMELLENPQARAEGYLTVDAAPLVAQVLLSVEDRGLPVSVLPQVPLEVRVVPESRFVGVADEYRAADAAARWLPVVWGGLVLLAVLVASGWRGRVRTVGFALLGVALAAGVVLLAVDPLVAFAKEQANAGSDELVELMLDVVLQSLSPYARGFLLAAPVGLVLVVASFWPRRAHDPRYSPVSGTRDPWDA